MYLYNLTLNRASGIQVRIIARDRLHVHQSLRASLQKRQSQGLC